jgi:thiol-disulfide isomerase/thioredoxin
MKQSASMGKMIFVDAYASWCAPCKVMDQEVFVDSMVAAYYNEHFINLKLDMEKGDGVENTKKYDVKAYPMFLFINAEGHLLHKGIGYMPPEDLIALGISAQNPSTQLASLSEDYDAGKRGDQVHLAYAQALYRARDERFDSVARAYLTLQGKWSDKSTRELVLQTAADVGDPYYVDIVKNKFLYIKAYGEGIVYGRILNILEKHYFEEINTIKLSAVKEKYAEVFPASKEDKFYDNFEMHYFERLGQKERYLEAAKKYVKKYPDLSWSSLNQLAWNIYENHNSSKALQLATRWAKKSVDLRSNHYNNDTLAALFYKQGKEKTARKYAERAIQLAKAVGADYSNTAELLEKINAMS